MKKNCLKMKKMFKMKKSQIDIQQPGNDFFLHVFSSKKFEFQTLKIILLLFNNLILWFGKWFSIFHFGIFYISK